MEVQSLEQAFGVEGERTLGSFSCELEDELSDMLVGRLVVFESKAGFYSFAHGRELVDALPFAALTDVAKRNLALFLPHAIDIHLRDRTLSLCGFSNREEVFELLKERWEASLHPTERCTLERRPLATTPERHAAAGPADGAVPRSLQNANAGAALTQRLRVATNGVLARATESESPLTAAHDADVVLDLLVSIEAVLEHGFCYGGGGNFVSGAAGRLLGRRGHFWLLLSQLSTLGGDAATGVAAAVAAGGGDGDAACAHAWLCRGLNRGCVHADLEALFAAEAPLHLHYAPCALLRDELCRSTVLDLLRPLTHLAFQLPLALCAWPPLRAPAPPAPPAAAAAEDASPAAAADDAAAERQAARPAARARDGSDDGRESVTVTVTLQPPAQPLPVSTRARGARRRAKAAARPTIADSEGPATQAVTPVTQAVTTAAPAVTLATHAAPAPPPRRDEHARTPVDGAEHATADAADADAAGAVRTSGSAAIVGARPAACEAKAVPAQRAAHAREAAAWNRALRAEAAADALLECADALSLAAGAGAGAGDSCGGAADAADGGARRRDAWGLSADADAGAREGALGAAADWPCAPPDDARSEPARDGAACHSAAASACAWPAQRATWAAAAAHGGGGGGGGASTGIRSCAEEASTRGPSDGPAAWTHDALLASSCAIDEGVLLGQPATAAAAAAAAAAAVADAAAAADAARAQPRAHAAVAAALEDGAAACSGILASPPPRGALGSAALGGPVAYSPRAAAGASDAAAAGVEPSSALLLSPLPASVSSSAYAQLCETSPMSVGSPGERALRADCPGELALHRVGAVRLEGARMRDDGARLTTVYAAEAWLGPFCCVAHRRYSHYVALQHELEAAFPRLQLPPVARELKQGRYTQFNWAPGAPLDGPAVEARLALLQAYVDALMGVRELALSPQLARFFWPREPEDFVETPTGGGGGAAATPLGA